MTHAERKAANRERNARIVEDLQAGVQLLEVARAHGVTHVAIDAIARHAGAPYPTPREYALLTALRMLLEGRTEAAITRKLKMPAGYVAEVRAKARAVGFKV